MWPQISHSKKGPGVINILDRGSICVQRGHAAGLAQSHMGWRKAIVNAISNTFALSIYSTVHYRRKSICKWWIQSQIFTLM